MHMASSTKVTKFGPTRLRLSSRPVILFPLIIFILFIVTSVILSSMSQSTLNNSRDRQMERRAQEDTLKLSSSMSRYAAIAAGGVGLANTGPVTEQNWGDFISAFNILNEFPAINSVAYAQVTGQADDGNPIISIQYIEPNNETSHKKLGINEYVVAARKDAIDRAVIENRPILTRMPEKVQSYDNPNNQPEPGFILFAPIFDRSLPIDTPQARKAALIGTSNVAFRASKFFDSIYADSEKVTHSFLTIYQGAGPDASKVYEGGVHPAVRDKVDYVHTVDFEGQTFRYDYQFSDSDMLTLIERGRPTTILLAGTFIGGLVSIIMLFIIRNRLQRISSDQEREVQSAKDELLSLASHQLRTPATGVKQYMGMVLQGFAGDITDQQKEFLQKAYDSNDRQLHIINDILHLAKLDAGRIVLSKTTFDMSELVRSVLDEQTDSANDGEVGLEHRIPKHLEVYADSHMMRMVVENLVSNAIKYTHPGGTVMVSLKSVKNTYELSVKDTGVGIADTDIDKLFRQFSRVDNERSHLVSGTGVGLYLVKNLIELHGGSVSLSSKLGKGTIFTISFPKEVRQ